MIPNYKRPKYREYIADVLERPLDDQDLDMINHVEMLESNYRRFIEKDELITKYQDYIKYLDAKIKEYEKYLEVETLIRKNTTIPEFSLDNNRINYTEIIKIPSRKILVNKSDMSYIEELLKKEGVI